MKKKYLAMILSLAMVTSMLTACGTSAQTEKKESVTEEYAEDSLPEATGETESAAEAVATDVTDPFGYDYVSQDVDADLTVYRYYADTDKTNLDYAINVMQQKYPNLTFTMEHRTDSDGSTLRTWAAVGELPDIFEINSAEVYQTLKEDGTLHVVDDEVENTKFYELFSNGDAAKEARTADDGHQYGFGCEASNLGELFYNKEPF